LKQREVVIKSFRDSSFALFRTLFQIFKRLVCVLFYSFAERGEKYLLCCFVFIFFPYSNHFLFFFLNLDHANPTWDVLDYHPEKTVSQTVNPEDENYKILRKMVSFGR
jgi:hypothetical protein